MTDIILENTFMRLTVGADARVRSLILKSTGEELLDTDEPCSLFSVTQLRPYNNEVKLSHPNKRTTFEARSVTPDEHDSLLWHVTFETVPVKADVRVTVTDAYAAFSLTGFTILPEDYGGIRITPPPVSVFRLLQLPVRNRRNFGEWMNVMWDERGGAAVMSATPWMRVDSEPRRASRILYAEVLAETGLVNRPAVLCAAPADHLLDCVAHMEEDFDLPRGVESRRGPDINASIYWVDDACPANIDAHIRYAKAAGLRMMLFYYTCFFDEYGCYSLIGNYDYRADYPDGAASVREMLDKVTAAGITPGLHVLHTHIGMSSRYVTPRTDPRLHLDRHVTLARPLSDDPSDAGDVYVLQNPAGSRMADGTRILKLGTELVSYEGFSTEQPYRYTGCVRGDHGTDVVSHPAGEIGGILDVSEFGAGSCYVDQETDLEDEIAGKIAALYKAGFRFMYFDGSEGAIPPYEIYVSLAQYRVVSRLSPAPIFCEGAAKSHFGWHWMSGGNAFDVFPPHIFKQKIAEHPLAEAPHMACDFTRINFGWWFFWDKLTQPDHYEFATSRAAAWNCPATMRGNLEAFASHPRTADIFEVMRRWEDVRAKRWLTEEQKVMLRHPTNEHHLLIDERGDYELIPVTRQRGCACGDERLRVFTFERSGHAWVVFWHANGAGYADVPLEADTWLYEGDLGTCVPASRAGGTIRVPVDRMRYLEADCSADVLLDALRRAMLHDA